MPWILAINVIALAVLYSRFQEEPAVVRIREQITHVLFPKLKPLEHGHVCGLLPLDWYILVSSRVVLPGGIQPAAGVSKCEEIRF